MFYNCTCPNCGYHYTPPSVPINLDWTQWQDITWYDDQGQPKTYPKYQTWFDDGTHIYRAILTDKIYRGEHRPDLDLYRALLYENTDAYIDGSWKPTAHLIHEMDFYITHNSWEPDRLEFDRLFGSRQNWKSIITEFTDYCSQLVPNDVAKSYSDRLVQK